MQSGLKDIMSGKKRMTDKGMFKGYTYDSLERQVDGSHYKGMKIQPAQFINENDLDSQRGVRLNIFVGIVRRVKRKILIKLFTT